MCHHTILDIFNSSQDIILGVLLISLPFKSLSWHISGNVSIMLHLVLAVILEAPLVASVFRAVSWNQWRDGDLLVAAGAGGHLGSVSGSRAQVLPLLVSVEQIVSSWE